MPGLRIDKWLWAARFFKTRSLAGKAVAGGSVHVNKQRVKPARILQEGDLLSLGTPPDVREIEVLGMPQRRGPASEAVTFYQETPASIASREQTSEARKIDRMSTPRPEGRPDKRSRRNLIRLRGR
ncbi:MAG: S4 domain-containing protein [Gammaproteobacteria bacterium]|jgi:ribosome-associated heat shock protein Hsp15|nr:S4 domain-containing protein [Gammaproteobacteria bacterium]